MLKSCYICKEKKEESEFYRQKVHGKERIASRCKTCNNKKSNARMMSLPVEKRRSLWREATKRTQERYPEKTLARLQVHEALRKGTLTRKDCEVCGEEKTQSHLYDYNKPLKIRWLCQLHHRMTHYPDNYQLPTRS